MGEVSSIEWCDSTFNPWIGCEKVSPGCAHCYAETLVTGRMNRPGTWGADGVRQRTSASTWAAPLKYERGAEQFLAEHGRRRRVFVASLADVFEPRDELEPWRADLFDLIRLTPSVDYLILTKRPEEAKEMLAELYAPPSVGAYDVLADADYECGYPANVWLGVSIENSRHTYRADVLRQIPAAVRFISAEPLLGSLFAPLRHRFSDRQDPRHEMNDVVERSPLDLTGIDWVIVGGESGGRSSRPMRPEWAREIRDAATGGQNFMFKDGPSYVPFRVGDPARGPAFLFKQWGSHDEHGIYRGASPKSGGRLLDGREWNEFPSFAPVPTKEALF